MFLNCKLSHENEFYCLGITCEALAPLRKQLVSQSLNTLSIQLERVLYQTCFQNWFDTSKIMDGG